MNELLKELKDETVIVELSLIKTLSLIDLLEKDVLKDGKETEVSTENICPRCNKIFHKGDYFCPHCGQRVFFVESDTIPL